MTKSRRCAKVSFVVDTWHSEVLRFLEAVPSESVLRLPFDEAPQQESHWPAEHCPSCGEVTTSKRSPYCGEVCREISGFVRQVRAAVLAGALSDDRRSAMEQVYWALLGGGYPNRLKEVPPSTVRKVLERAAYRCHRCGGEADQIEHLRTACNRPINLGAVCRSCQTTREMGDSEFLSQSEVGRIRSEVGGRIVCPTPSRRCDDPKAWDWRAFLNEREA